MGQDTTIVAESINVGSLISQLGPVFNALAYGSAKTDATIQKAINAAQVNGGVVYVPAGIWNFTTGLTITKSNVALIGDGAGATIFQTPSGSETVAMLVVGDNVNTTADVVIKDIQFKGATQKTANSAIKLQKCFRTHIERIRTQNQFRSLHVFNSTETWLDDSDIRDTSENGIVFESTLGNGNTLFITNVNGDNPVATNTGSGISWLGGETLVIQNCNFIHFQQGHLIAPPTGQQCRFGFYVNAEFDSSSDNCIKIAPTGGDVVALTFTNGWTGTATNYGVLIDNTGGAGLLQGVRFIGHKSLHNGLAGFRLVGGLDIHIDNCDVISNSQTVANNRSGIEIASGMSSGSFSIVGCRCTNGYQQGNTQSNGINFDNATYNNGLIADNYLVGNTNNGLALNGAVGTMQIRGNKGYNPVGNIAAPGVPNSTTPLTNNFGVDCTVHIVANAGGTTAVAIGGTSTGITIAASGNASFRVPAGQTITLTYTSAPTWTWFGE